jgi:hypothetical protein
MLVEAEMNQFDGELAALEHLRKMEDLDASPVSTALGTFADTAGQLGIPGACLFRSALKSGQTPVRATRSAHGR